MKRRDFCLSLAASGAAATMPAIPGLAASPAAAFAPLPRPWMLAPSGDLTRDVVARRHTDGHPRRLMILFHRSGSAACEAAIRRLDEAREKPLLRRLNIMPLDITSPAYIRDLHGIPRTAAQMARRWGVAETPALVELRPAHGGAWRNLPKPLHAASFQRAAEAKIIRNMGCDFRIVAL